jgi:hypothetical protein
VEEHHAEEPDVRCIQREVQGAEWECRAEAANGEFHCHVKANEPHQKIYEIHCEGHAAEGEHAGEGDGDDGHEDDASEPAGDHADEPAGTGGDDPAEEESDGH